MMMMMMMMNPLEQCFLQPPRTTLSRSAPVPGSHAHHSGAHLPYMAGAYMPPEARRVPPEPVGVEFDWYTLGVTLFELLCNKLPGKLDDTTVITVMQ